MLTSHSVRCGTPLMLFVCLLLWVLPAGADEQIIDDDAVDMAVQASERTYIRAAHWFGGSWPVGFWNTDLESRASEDFDRLKADGFNTVVFLVPWAGFAPDPTSGELDPVRVQRLRQLMTLADDKGLMTILRVSYGWDSLEQGEDGARMAAVWLSDAHHQGWLDYMGALWEAVSDLPGLQFGFFSWEDVWAVMNFPGANLNQRLAAARDTGYVEWLRERNSLEAVADVYRQRFSSWDEVPIPSRNEPAFRYFLEFINSSWVERFFVPAQRRFPRLSMEVRIDADPVWDGDELLEWFSHEKAWNLPGAEWVTLYWAPSMGGRNQGEILEPTEAAERLAWWLDRVRAAAGPRGIFIGQFLAEDFTPGYEQNGRIAREDVPEFLELAGSVMAEKADGVGLWTWTDYGHDQVRNPEFFADLAGWSHAEGVVARDGRVALDAGQWLIAHLQASHHAGGGPERSEACITGRAVNGSEAEVVLSIQAEPGPPVASLNFGPEWSRQCAEHPARNVVELRLDASSAVEFDQVSTVSFVQKSGMRELDNEAKPVADAYRALNRSLEQRTSRFQSRYPDGWMGRFLIKEMALPEGAYEVHLQTYLPSDWPEAPELTVVIDGHIVGTVSCRVEGDYRFELPAGVEGSVQLTMESSATHQPPGDARNLGCHLTRLAAVGGDGRP